MSDVKVLLHAQWVSAYLAYWQEIKGELAAGIRCSSRVVVAKRSVPVTGVDLTPVDGGERAASSHIESVNRLVRIALLLKV